MTGMDVFENAFNFFLKTGRFELLHSKLSIKQLLLIKQHIQAYPSDTAYYEICLHDVELIPFHIEELIDLRKTNDIVLSGDIVEQELPSSLKNRSLLHSEDNSLRILNYFEKMELFLKKEYEYAYETIETTLLSLFAVSQWKVIKLENFRIVVKEESKFLNFQFIENLYNTLAATTDQIKELSLKKVDLFNRNKLATFVQKLSQLEILGLEDISSENERFNSHNDPSIFITRLCEMLGYHSSLKQLDLGDTKLNESDYEALFKLLNNNYRLETILLKPPLPFGFLNDLHHQLIHQMKERAKQSSLVRFQEKQLIHSNICKVAALSLEFIETYPLDFKFNQNTKELTIIYPSNQKLPQTFINALPKELSNYPEFLQKSFPIQLDLSQLVNNQTTLGAQLLEKAFHLRKPKAMQLLLVAGADLLEHLPNKPSLIANIFSDQEEKIYKELILNHIKKDLSVFVPFISRLVPKYGKIKMELTKIKLYLDLFITTLLELDQLPFLLRIFKGIGLKTKKENWEKDFRLVVRAAQVGTQKNPITHTSLSDFEACILILYSEIQNSKKQWFRGYQFNCLLLRSLDQLLQATREYQSALFKEWEQQEGGILIENIQLKEELKIAKQTIEEMKTQHFQDKAKFESKRAKTEIRKEFEFKQMQDRIDIQNKIRAEFELKRAQDRAEFEQNNAVMEAKIEKIMAMLQRQEYSSTSEDNSMPSNSPSFFNPR